MLVTGVSVCVVTRRHNRLGQWHRTAGRRDSRLTGDYLWLNNAWMSALLVLGVDHSALALPALRLE